MKKSISIIVFLVSLLFSYKISAAQVDPCFTGIRQISHFNSLIHPASCQTNYDVFFEVAPGASADLGDEETSHYKIKVSDLMDQIFTPDKNCEFRISKYPSYLLQRSSKEIFRLNCTLRL